jgi:hypothetical protein
MTQSNALDQARAVGAVLFDYNFGFSLVLGIFAWIFASGLIVGAIPALSDRLLTTSFVCSVMDGQRSPMSAWALRRNIDGLEAEPDPVSYMRKFMLGWLRVAALAAAALSAVSLFLLGRELHTYSLFTPEAYIRSPFF